MPSTTASTYPHGPGAFGSLWTETLLSQTQYMRWKDTSHPCEVHLGGLVLCLGGDHCQTYLLELLGKLDCVEPKNKLTYHQEWCGFLEHTNDCVPLVEGVHPELWCAVTMVCHNQNGPCWCAGSVQSDSWLFKNKKDMKWAQSGGTWECSLIKKPCVHSTLWRKPTKVNTTHIQLCHLPHYFQAIPSFESLSFHLSFFFSPLIMVQTREKNKDTHPGQIVAAQSRKLAEEAAKASASKKKADEWSGQIAALASLEQCMTDDSQQAMAHAAKPPSQVSKKIICTFSVHNLQSMGEGPGLPGMMSYHQDVSIPLNTRCCRESGGVSVKQTCK